MDMPVKKPDMSTMAMTLAFDADVGKVLFKEWVVNKESSPNSLYLWVAVLIYLSCWFVNFLHNYKLLCQKNNKNTGYERISKINDHQEQI